MKIELENLILPIALMGVFILLVTQSPKKHTYLIKRLDNGMYQRETFSSVHNPGDTILVYDQLNGADGPVFLEIKAIVQDTIL